MKNPKVILGVTASIAAYKAADIAGKLIEKGFEVSIVMTKEAQHFITPLTLSTITKDVVYQEMFTASCGGQIPHIRLAQEADIVLIAPATANTIGKIAAGIADDLLTCLVLATTVKILIAPAMNTQMYKNQIVQENMAKLKKMGMKFIDPAYGELACGTLGEGHIAEVDKIVKAVIKNIKL